MKYQPKNKQELKELVKNENIYLGDIDTSLITDMSYLFSSSKRKDFSGIEKWNVSNVRYLNSTFEACEYFNVNINDWDVSNVRELWRTFSFCYKFNQPLNKWNVQNVECTEETFFHCYEFEQDLHNWDLSNAKNHNNMFSGCWKLLKTINLNHKNKPKSLLDEIIIKNVIHEKTAYEILDGLLQDKILSYEEILPYKEILPYNLKKRIMT